MTGSKDLPWFPFFATDWLTDPRVRAMSPAGRGVYVDLLAYQWREGSVSSDSATNHRLVGGIESDGSWLVIWSQVRPHFALGGNVGKGRMKNRRLEKVRAEQLALLRARISRAQAGGRASGVSRKRKAGKPLEDKQDTPERKFNCGSTEAQLELNSNEQSQSQSQSQIRDKNLSAATPQAGAIIDVECYPVYWEPSANEIIIDVNWLREKLRAYAADAHVVFTTKDVDAVREDLRLRLLEDRRLRALRVKKDGKPSSSTQFRSLESLTVGHYKRAIRRMAGRSKGGSRSKVRKSLDAIDSAFSD